MPSWRRNRHYILILATASGLILLLGAMFRPQDKQDVSAPPVAQTEIARLQRLATRNNVSDIASYFAELALNIDDQVLRLPGAGRSAVIWSSDRIVSPAAPRARPPPTAPSAARAVR